MKYAIIISHSTPTFYSEVVTHKTDIKPYPDPLTAVRLVITATFFLGGWWSPGFYISIFVSAQLPLVGSGAIQETLPLVKLEFFFFTNSWLILDFQCVFYFLPIFFQWFIYCFSLIISTLPVFWGFFLYKLSSLSSTDLHSIIISNICILTLTSQSYVKV